MVSIEDVKKILEDNTTSWGSREEWLVEIAKQICQLFEPEPEDRLLTPKEIATAIHSIPNPSLDKLEIRIAKAQDAKTASIKDAECQARIDRIATDISVFNDELDHTTIGDKEFRRMVTGKWLQGIKVQEGD